MCFLLLMSIKSYSQRNNNIKTVVIDPGHGGKTLGQWELRDIKYMKKILLEISLRLGKYIEKIS